jgi:uroporphyrinogen III methyltransferase/synthase
MQSNRVDIRVLSGKRFVTIGKSTADSLAKYSIYADLMPDTYTSKALADTILTHATPSDNYLILRASNGSKEFTETLQANGIHFKDIPIYSLECNPQPLENFPTEKLDYIVFGSSMGVREYFKHATLPPSVGVVAIGEVCKSTLESLGLPNAIHMADTYTVDGITKKILELSET